MKSKFITYWTYNIYIATSQAFPVQLGTTLVGVTIDNSMTVSQIPACPPPPTHLNQRSFVELKTHHEYQWILCDLPGIKRMFGVIEDAGQLWNGGTRGSVPYSKVPDVLKLQRGIALKFQIIIYICTSILCNHVYM